MLDKKGGTKMAGIKLDKMLVTKLPKKPVAGKPIIVVSVSGGKDSIGMWLAMWKRKVPNLVPVSFMGGWEWECVDKTIHRAELITGIPCNFLRYPRGFDGILKDRGWPSWRVRWCTGMKRDKLMRFISSVRRGNPGFKVLSAIGIAADEKIRLAKEYGKRPDIIFPLASWGIKEAHCLRICASNGIDFSGHYLVRKRQGCWCCPWQSINDWRVLYEYHPEKWKRLVEMNRWAPKGRKFSWAQMTLGALSKKLAAESKKGMI